MDKSVVIACLYCGVIGSSIAKTLMLINCHAGYQYIFHYRVTKSLHQYIWHHWPGKFIAEDKTSALHTSSNFLPTVALTD